MAPFVTFTKDELQSLHHTDIQQHGLHVMTGSPSLFSLCPPFFPSWALGEMVQAAAALLSKQHLSPSLSPWGTADNT